MNPNPAREGMTRYVVVGCPRSGTTAVHLALKGHPQASALNDEIRVSPFFDRGLAAFTFGHESPEDRQVTQRSLFDAITSVDASAETRALGLKVCPATPWEGKLLVNALRANFSDVKIVLIDREDLVAQFGSLTQARRTGVWHSWYPSAGKAEVAPRKLSRWMFSRYALQCLDTMRVLRSLEQSHQVFVCKYDALVADDVATYRSIFGFVGLADLPITWFQAKKVMPAPQRYIANYDELTRMLARLRDQHARGAVSPLLRRTLETMSRGAGLWARVTGGAADAGPG
jgi:hypothetical protein